MFLFGQILPETPPHVRLAGARRKEEIGEHTRAHTHPGKRTRDKKDRRRGRGRERIVHLLGEREPPLAAVVRGRGETRLPPVIALG